MARDYPVYISEYEMPEDFVSIWSKEKVGLFKKTKGGEYHNHIENVFLHKAWLGAHRTEPVDQDETAQQMEFEL